MSDLRTSNQALKLYCQCFEQLLPIARHRIHAIQLDWWDLDRFLGLAFHVFVTEKDPHVLTQISQLLPRFGAKAVLPLVVILNAQVVEPELKSFVHQSMSRFDETELVSGLFTILQMSEDESYDHQIAQILMTTSPAANQFMKTLLENSECPDLVSRILPRIQISQQLSKVFKELESSLDPNAEDEAAILNTQSIETLLQIASAEAERQTSQRAIDLYSEVIRVCPDNARAYGERGLLELNLGYRKLAMDDLRQAADLFRQQGKKANYEVAMGYLNTVF